MSSSAAISFYHDLLYRPGLADDSWALLTARMAERGMVFGERLICTVMRPLFYTPPEWRYLAARTELIARIFDRLARQMLEDGKLRAQIHATAEEEELFQIEQGYDGTIPTARLDSFYARKEDGTRNLSFVEINGESPASMAYSDVLGGLFLEMPVMQAFGQRYALRNTAQQKTRRQRVSARLLRMARQSRQAARRCNRRLARRANRQRVRVVR